MSRNANMSPTTRILLVFIAIALLFCGCSASDEPQKETLVLDELISEESNIELKKYQEFVVLESNGGTYSGPALDNDYIGKGKFQYLSGGVYEGEFSESQREGLGTFTWENGDSFYGTWKDDSMIDGTYTFADGRVFTGSFRNNLFYDGTFTVQTIPDKLKLTGFSATFVAGEVDSVHLTTTSGAKYDGQITGVATILYASGNIYDGGVIDGVRDGNGTYYWTEKGNIIAYYVGNWKNGKMEGEGIYHYSSQTYPYIKGTFKKGKLEGKAIYYKESGYSFTTTWKKGVCKSVK